MGKSKIPKEFKLSKKLDPYIKDVYKHKIGIPDLSQNWLELFHGTVIDDLFTIMHSNSDNQLKSDYVEELLKPFGFTSDGGGLGTNILVLTHPYYPGVVFKIALDENGIADNFNDCLLQEQIPQYAKVYARHPSGIVTAQERYFVMKPEFMPLYKNKILEALKVLSKDYLIADLTPSMLLNYGIDRHGDFVFIDGSDLYPLKQIKDKDRLRCKAITGSYKNGELKYCRGKCKYNDDFSQMICEKCGKTYIPIELRPRKEEINMKNIFSDGFTIDDREELERRSREAMKTGHFEPYIPDHVINNKEDEDDMSKYITKLPEGYHIQRWTTKEGEVIKIAVKNGYHVVGIDGNGNYITKPDTFDKNNKNDKSNHKSNNIRTVKKMKKVVHNEPDIIRVPQEINNYDMTQQKVMVQDTTQNNTEVIQPNNKPTEAYKAKLLNQKAKFPEDFKVYVSDLIEIIGWDMIDSFREDTDAFVTMKNLLNEKEHELKKAMDNINRLEAENTELRDQNTLLGMQLEVLEKRVIKNEAPNNIIQKMQLDENSDCIHYQVIEETEQDSSDLPGIYFHVRGDITKAYDDYGLPIYVCVEGYNSIALAVTARSLQEDIYDAYDDVIGDNSTEPVIIISGNDEDEPAPNANPDISEYVKHEEFIEDLKSYTTIFDDDEELTEEQDNTIIHQMVNNPNSNTNIDPRYEMANDGSVHI